MTNGINETEKYKEGPAQQTLTTLHSRLSENVCYSVVPVAPAPFVYRKISEDALAPRMSRQERRGVLETCMHST